MDYATVCAKLHELSEVPEPNIPYAAVRTSVLSMLRNGTLRRRLADVADVPAATPTEKALGMLVLSTLQVDEPDDDTRAPWRLARLETAEVAKVADAADAADATDMSDASDAADAANPADAPGAAEAEQSKTGAEGCMIEAAVAAPAAVSVQAASSGKAESAVDGGACWTGIRLRVRGMRPPVEMAELLAMTNVGSVRDERQSDDDYEEEDDDDDDEYDYVDDDEDEDYFDEGKRKRKGLYGRPRGRAAQSKAGSKRAARGESAAADAPDAGAHRMRGVLPSAPCAPPPPHATSARVICARSACRCQLRHLAMNVPWLRFPQAALQPCRWSVSPPSAI